MNRIRLSLICLTLFFPAVGFAHAYLVLLALFTAPQSLKRLEELNQAYEELRSLGVEILAVPREQEQRSAKAVPLLPIVTDGSREIFETYAGENVGWSKMENLLREIDRLNQEQPSAPAPADHVH
ncbi:MAG TPA: hypothetical protein VGL11_21330 [Candidatus Binatia bacterium]